MVVKYSDKPVVINKVIGLGHVVLIGHDYYESNPDADKILSNAVFKLPVIYDNLRLIPTVGFTATGKEGGPFTPSSQIYQLNNRGESNMATLSIRIPDGLKTQLASVAQEEGVSMNNFICSCLSAAVAQERASIFFANRLEKRDRDLVRKRYATVMSKTRKGRPPSMRDIDKLISSE